MYEFESSCKLSKFPFGALVKVHDLIECEGPLLSVYRNGRDEHFLFLWVDSDDFVNRWLAVKVDDYGLNLLYSNRRTIYDAFYLHKHVYVVDLDSNLFYKNVYKTTFEFLPIEYKPDKYATIEHIMSIKDNKNDTTKNYYYLPLLLSMLIPFSWLLPSLFNFVHPMFPLIILSASLVIALILIYLIKG